MGHREFRYGCIDYPCRRLPAGAKTKLPPTPNIPPIAPATVPLSASPPVTHDSPNNEPRTTNNELLTNLQFSKSGQSYYKSGYLFSFMLRLTRRHFIASDHASRLLPYPESSTPSRPCRR